MAAPVPVILTNQLGKVYSAGTEAEVVALHGVNLRIERGEFVAIMGPSGSGKSTLMNLLGCLDTPTSGRCECDGVDVATLDAEQLAQLRRDKIGFVFQFHQLLPEFTALENVMIPALIAKVQKKEAEKKAQELLHYLGLTNRLLHKPNELSGGEKQRVAVARALINNPSIILADEPSGSLDSRNKEELHQLLVTLNRDLGITLLVVTHDTNLAYLSNRIIEMQDGIIIGEKLNA